MQLYQHTTSNKISSLQTQLTDLNRSKLSITSDLTTYNQNLALKLSMVPNLNSTGTFTSKLKEALSELELALSESEQSL